MDILILRNLMKRVGMVCRWTPGARQIADGLTKGRAEAMDAPRAILRTGTFCLGHEAEALKARAAEKARRLARGAANKKANETGAGKGKRNPTDSLTDVQGTGVGSKTC